MFLKQSPETAMLSALLGAPPTSPYPTLSAEVEPSKVIAVESPKVIAGSDITR